MMEPEQNYDDLFLEIEAQAETYRGYGSIDDEIMPGISPVWYKELAGRNIPPPIWVVDKLIPAEGITIVSAPPAQYKTWLVLDIAIQVAHGNALFGHFETKQTNVLIVDEESGPGRLRKRLQMLGINDETPIAISSYMRFKLDEESANSTINYCLARRIKLVIFDSLTRLHNGDENSSKDMSIVMGNLKRFAQEGISVIVIHHNRKPGQFGGGGGNDMRGSGDILAACDVQISVKRKAGTETITVSQNKNRDAADMAPFDLGVASNDDSFCFDYVGKAQKQIGKLERTDEAIRELLANGALKFQDQIIGAINGVEHVGGQKMIAERLKAMLDMGELVRTIGTNGKHLYQLNQGNSDE